MTEPNTPSAERRVRNIRPRGLAVLGALCCAAPGAAVSQGLEPLVGAYVTLTSDYRHRGLSESAGEPSIQVGADYQRANGFFAGAWAARIDYAYEAPDSSTRFKVGYYLGVSKRVSRWSWTATAVHYEYPGLEYDYDYDELSATAGFRDRVFFTAAYIDDFFARGRSAFYSELGSAVPLPNGFEIGATIGRVASSDPRLEYTHWNVGVAKTFAQRIGVDLRYHDVSRSFSNAVATANADSWVLSASYGFRSR